ncbi:hypothetical protein Bhyg_03424 [Pseudolycoriella hygida]|uniref:Uncharacterized protein n=1 Tax=Pseudolycoriella hygida TaxID=35572 RepID=A0A9Q0NDB4_9DIPT|nr:hypothetical protein Bhyg_03424 [Pseudolycoriella hygida]
MKSVLFVLIAFAVVLYLSFANAQKNPFRTCDFVANMTEQISGSLEASLAAKVEQCNHIASVDFEKKLSQQYDEAAGKILKAWLRCNRSLKVPFDEAIDLFQNPPWGDERYVPYKAKCLVDCTLRSLKVMTEEGFDAELYHIQIKQLRLNYTTFEANEEEQKILGEMHKRAMRFSRNCYSVGNPSKTNMSLDEFEHQKCFELIKIYAHSAIECENVQDPKGDKCETSWMLMKCIIIRNRYRSFNSPFYPIMLDQLQ